ncbi:hypothetical protein ABT075_03040 [Streptomyces sp. NPDC002677]|uniref:hypothetical protein n=1 Tax=Streptomyces sp. NPDC002677 TaxID=3154774 RepID=UPI00332F831B
MSDSRPVTADEPRLGLGRRPRRRFLKGMDVVFPSGQPAAKMILDRQQGVSAKSARPFVTPLVLATFREYAETLVKAGVAGPQPGSDAVSEVREEFQDEEYSDGVEFQARCLAKVRSWNRRARELTLDPLAVFR